MFDGTVLFGTKEAMQEAYGKLFADSPDLDVAIAGRMKAGEFVATRNTFRAFTSVTCRRTWRQWLSIASSAERSPN
jgi:hypothetical protein